MHRINRPRPPSRWGKSITFLLRTRVPVPVPVALIVLLFVSYSFPPTRYSAGTDVPHVHVGDMNKVNALDACFDVPVEQLLSFDTYAATLKARGIPQTTFENRFQELVWDTLDLSTALYFPAESDKAWKIKEYGRGLENDLKTFARLSERVGATVHDAAYIHTRADRIRGLQYVGLLRRSDGSEVLLSARVPHGQGCELQATTVTSPAPRVHLVVPYSNRAERLRLLLENIHSLRAHGSDIVAIICVLRGAIEDKNSAIQLAALVFGGDWQNAVAISENDGDVNGQFSRGVALRDAVQYHVPSREDVVFLCDVDLLVTPQFVVRCARNAILGQQVYYPVFYSLFPYSNKNPGVRQFGGFWRVTSFGMVCLTRADFYRINPFGDAETRFQGWGSEDVYMHELIRNSTELVALRAVEPGLIHRWHSKNCDKTSKDYWNCMKTNFVTMGHPLRIGPQLVQELQSDARLFEIITDA